MPLPKLSEVEPFLLTRIDIRAILRHAGYLIPRQSERPPGQRPSKAGRPPASGYVGVTVHRNRYVAQYRQGGERKVTSFPQTPEFERQAAIDRARGLGLDYLERRDGTREMMGEDERETYTPVRLLRAP